MQRSVSLILATLVLTLLILGASTSAQAALRPGCYDLGGHWSLISLRSSDARAYGNLLAQPDPRAVKLSKIVSFLSRYAPGGPVWEIANKCCVYMWVPLKLRIDWCAKRAPYVYIYHYWGVPAFADPAW